MALWNIKTVQEGRRAAPVCCDSFSGQDALIEGLLQFSPHLLVSAAETAWDVCRAAGQVGMLRAGPSTWHTSST